jgi:hypothetical protein
MAPYDISDLKRVKKEPKLVLRELNKQIYSSFGRHESNPDGRSIFKEDWDNLLIFDACRYDFFEQQSELPGELRSRTALGSCTPEFVEYNFRNKQLLDTVYITANSWFLKLRDKINSEVHDLYDLLSSPERKYSDPEHKIVLADTITSVAKEANKKYPNKRLIIHYIQPHHPFVGPTGQEYFERDSSSLREVVRNEPEATRELVAQAYRENVDHVLSAAKDLLPELKGKTVITADHGEMIGERHEYIPIREYGHPPGIWSDVLTTVPWYIHTYESRKEIIAEQPNRNDANRDMYEVDERLKTLGYKM